MFGFNYDKSTIKAIREIKILKALKNENIVQLKEMIVYDKDTDTEITPELAETAGLINGDIFMMFEFCDFDLSGLLRSPKVVIAYMLITNSNRN